MLAGLTGLLGGGVSANAGSYDSISTVTASGTSVMFSSIPSTYKHLQVRAAFTMSSGNPIKLTLNGDTGTNYAFHYLYGDGTNRTAGGTASNANIQIAAGNGSSASPYSNVYILDIHDYANTSKYKTTRGVFGSNQNSSTASLNNIELDSGLWQSTSAVNSITFTGFGDTIVGSFALYGIKG